MPRLVTVMVAIQTLSGAVPVPGPPRLVREQRPPILLAGSPSGQARWLDDTTLALADVEEQRVMIADPATGRIRAVAGRAGEGPGEYRGVGVPVPGPDGSFAVVDSRLRRLTILTSRLEVRRTVTLPVVINAVLGWNGADLYCTWYDFARQVTPVLGTLRVGAGERAEAVPLVRLDSLFGMVRRDPFALPPMVAAASGARGTVLLGILNEYRILRLSSDARVVTKFTRPELAPARFSVREVETETAKLRGAARVPVPTAAATRVKDLLTGMVKPFFSLSGLSEDPAGRLWVVTARATTDSTEVDVFSPGGRFLGTLKLRGLVRSLAWNGSRVAAVVEREPGEERLGVVDFYRLK